MSSYPVPTHALFDQHCLYNMTSGFTRDLTVWRDDLVSRAAPICRLELCRQSIGALSTFKPHCCFPGAPHLPGLYPFCEATKPDCESCDVVRALKRLERSSCDQDYRQYMSPHDAFPQTATVLRLHFRCANSCIRHLYTMVELFQGTKIRLIMKQHSKCSIYSLRFTG